MKKILFERDCDLRCHYIYVGCSESCGLYECDTPSAEHRELGIVRDSELRPLVTALVRLLRRQRLARRNVKIEGSS